MIAERTDSDEMLSPEGTAALLRLLAGPRRRLSSAEIDGRAVWIKRFDAERRPIAKWLHVLLSPVLPFAFLRASPAANAASLAEREARKAAGFRAAGIPTPAILHRGDAVLVLSGVAEIVEDALRRLRAADAAEHDATLVDMAAALGRVHARGLCHGRPHPRDMFRSGGVWGFLDFEEEPEASMPLAVAQARDVWLLFMQIAGRSLQDGTDERAFAAWRAEAPAAVLPELRKAVSFFSIFLPGLRLFQPLGLGKDGRRLLDATSFLRSVLRETDRAAPAAAKPTQDRIGTPT